VRWVIPLIGAVLAVTSSDGSAKSASSGPPLPPPSGAVVRVSTEAGLQEAVRRLRSGTTILIARGTYRLTSTLPIGNGVEGVALRGETGNRDDVVLLGPGMTNADYGGAPHGIWMGNGASNVLIANLTVTGFYFHPVIVNAGTTAPHFYNVRLADGGQQLMKVNPDADGKGVDRGIVEYSVIEFTTRSRDHYTNGVDVLGGAGWIVRHNLFRNIQAPRGQLAGPTIMMIRGARDSLVEGNTFVNCQREIAFGLGQFNGNDHHGGIIRNNFIYRDASVAGDAAINVIDSPGTQVLHNTIVTSGTYPNAIEYRFPGATGVLIANNLTDAAITSRDGGVADLRGNYTNATPAFFVNPAAGDLHLRATATAALNKGVVTAGADTDWDGDRRPGGPPDIGADELQESR